MPIVVMQPDEASGKDVLIRSDAPDTNYDLATLGVGQQWPAGVKFRSLIQFDLSSIPAGARVVSASLALQWSGNAASQPGTFRAYRLKLPWVESEVTWNSRCSGAAWQAAGAFGADDCEQEDIGSLVLAADESAGCKVWDLNAAKVQEWISGTFANNGLLLKSDLELDDWHRFFASAVVVAWVRPKLTVEFAMPGAVPAHYYNQRRRS